MVALCVDGVIDLDSVPQYIKGTTVLKQGQKTDLDLTKRIEKLEMETIMEALKKAEGKKSRAAKYLNIPRSTLYYKMKLYGLDLEGSRF